MIDKPNNFGIVAAGVAAGVLLAVCVQAYRHPVVRPIYRWVRIETIWRAPDVQFMRLRVGPYYAERRACLSGLPPSGLVTLGRETRRHEFYCVWIRKHAGK